MIYTLTLNPAVDYVLHIESLTPDSIMRSCGENIFFGGKGINVSLILAELGVPSVAGGFVGGFTGVALCEAVSSPVIKTDFVEVKDGLTRINVKIRSYSDGGETDINAGGPHITEGDIERLFQRLESLVEGDVVVLAGSIPASLPSDIYERIMARFSPLGVHFAVDATGDLLLNTLKYKPFLIKPNHEELGQLFGVTVTGAEDAFLYAEKLQNMGASNVLVSMGANGAVLLDQTGGRHVAKAHRGDVKNTVGAGDSTVGGFLAGYLEKYDFEYALRLGVAAGSATAFSEGLATGDEILKYYRGEAD